MEISLTSLKKAEGPLSLDFSAADFPELEEAGCNGNVCLNLKVTPATNSLWVEGHIAGDLKYECPGCGGPLKGEFETPFKLLIEPKDGEGAHWLEDEAPNYDEYIVQVGADVENLNVLNPVREQIVLNCSPWKPQDAKKIESCEYCTKNPQKLNSTKNSQEIDPRWEKLKDLL